MTRSKALGLGIIALSVLGAAACGKVGFAPEQTGSLLSRAESCDDLLGMIRRDAVAKVNETAEQALINGSSGYYGVEDGVGMGVGGVGGSGGGPVGSGGSGASAGSPPRAPNGHSETNEQVEGVHEADIVKTDGEHLWLLHGAELEVVRSWPPQSIEVTSSLAIEGTPTDMLVEGGRAIVFSTATEVISRGVDDYGYPIEEWRERAKITVVNLDGDSPRVEREIYTDGSYRSARAHGSKVRVVVDGGFRAPPETIPSFSYGYYPMPSDPAWSNGATSSVDESWVQAVEIWRTQALAAIARSTLADWLPVTSASERAGGEIVAQAPDCSTYYVPVAGSSGDGLTTVLSLDAAAPTAALGRTAVLGATDEVYANQDALVLAHAEYSWSWPADPQTTTLHRFALAADGGTNYVASGRVPGHLLDQFSIDEKDGILRVSITDDRQTELETTTENRVLALATRGESLDVIGDTGPIAGGERIYSTRFVGDKGYVVTFRQVDPLFVIDLAIPTAPRVLGELHIPGFSEYMHPLDATHLLTIGQDMDVSGTGPQRLMLQIFDISEPTAPRLAHKHVFSKEGSSEASYEHKAFTFFADRGLLAFPFYGYDNWDYSSQASLEVFAVSAESGFSQLGSIDHSSLMYENRCPQDSCYEYYGYEPQLRRGVFIDDYVYSVSDGGVLVHAISDLRSPVATLALPAPAMQ